MVMRHMQCQSNEWVAITPEIFLQCFSRLIAVPFITSSLSIAFEPKAHMF